MKVETEAVKNIGRRARTRRNKFWKNQVDVNKSEEILKS